MHPLLIPPFTNKTLRRAVKDYLDGGDRKKIIVEKYGEISNWDTSRVTDMHGLFHDATSFNQPLNKWNVSNVTKLRKTPNEPGLVNWRLGYEEYVLWRKLLQPAAQQVERV